MLNVYGYTIDGLFLVCILKTQNDKTAILFKLLFTHYGNNLFA